MDFENALRALVAVESPSSDPVALRTAQQELATVGSGLVGVAPDWTSSGSGPATLRWDLGADDDPRRILVLGHVDTVWPVGTLAERPFAIDGDVARGPGVFDMKAGLVVGLQALAELGEQCPVTFLVTADEEVGSAASRDQIEELARKSQACLVLEGSGPQGALKSARSGWSFYTFTFRGVGAHAGLDPGSGSNALTALTDLTGRLTKMNAPHDGTTVTATMAHAGTTVNTVPDYGELVVDVRCGSQEQQRQVDDALRKLAGRSESGVHVSVSGGVNRPPMPERSARPLLDRLTEVTADRGCPMPGDVAVGGISDANLTAGVGTPTLDGLGAVGGGPHAAHEWVALEATRRRVGLVTALATSLVDAPLPSTSRDREEGSS